MSKWAVYVGIAVAQSHLEVQVSAEPASWRVTYDTVGLRTLCERLASWSPALIVLEATGGLETAVWTTLSEAGWPVALANPRQVRDFARALGQRAKTDALDAQVLARFAEQIQPAVRPLPDAQTRALRSRVGRRRQVVRLMAQERVHRHSAPPDMQHRIDPHWAWLMTERDALDGEIQDLLQAQARWRRQRDQLTSVPGLGPVAAGGCSRNYPNWAKCRTANWRLSWASHPSTGTAASSAAAAPSEAGGPRCARPSTWRRCPPRA